MDNERLAKRSETFTDDQGQTVEKRCFFLCCGNDDVSSDFLNVRTTINIFDEPRAPQRLEITVKPGNTIIEISKEVIQSGSLLIPEFSAFFRYTDLYPCRANLNRRLELYTPIHAIKE